MSKIVSANHDFPRNIPRALRVHQWVKNVLIFVPMATAHKLYDHKLLLMSLLAFASFCLISSGTYIVNDLKDLEADRQHPEKRSRPLASGRLSPRIGVLLMVLSLSSGFALSLLLPLPFQLILLLYALTTLAYTFLIKSMVLVDVIALAAMFTLRIFAGASAIQVPVSHWLLAFSMFIFLSLAFLKRYAELHNLKNTERRTTPGRGYLVDDLESMATFGVSAGCIAVLVLALFVSNPEVLRSYERPELLWLLCPIIFYWICRMWLFAKRGLMREDPILFAFKDRASYLVGILVWFCVLMAI